MTEETWGESKDFDPDYSLDPWHDPNPTPILFLDVDGVVNAFPGTAMLHYTVGKASPGEGYTRSFQITWDQTIIDRLKALHDSGKVRIMWLTTWGRGANGDLRELLGFDEFVVAKHPDRRDLDSYGTGWWKLRTVNWFLENNPDRKYVWCDDELAWNNDACDAVADYDVLCIGPMEYRGLTHEDLDRIEEFLST